MNTNHFSLRKWLLPMGLVLAALVIVGGTLEWSLALVYALTVLMFAAVFGARFVERRERRKR